jgi:hypothetical protein
MKECLKEEVEKAGNLQDPSAGLGNGVYASSDSASDLRCQLLIIKLLTCVHSKVTMKHYFPLESLMTMSIAVQILPWHARNKDGEGVHEEVR